MRTKLNIILLAFATVSISLHAGTTPFPAPLPKFMNQEQMAKWNAEEDAAAAKTVSSTQETPTQFYTGKPYVADAGGYLFKYRTYNPEMSRWTSADPSGFPDGINNQTYYPIPTHQLDFEGLITWNITKNVASFLNPKAQTELNALAGAINAIAAGYLDPTIGIDGVAWNITSFTATASGSGSATGTGSFIGIGNLTVKTPFTYTLPSGMQPTPSSGSVGTTSGSLVGTQPGTLNGTIGPGTITLNFNPPKKVYAGYGITDTMTSLTVSNIQATVTINFTLTEYE